MPFTPRWPTVSSPTSTTRASNARSPSGGDPLHPQNVPEILALVRRIRAECPGKDIWVWTGYKLDELNDAAGSGGSD
jgi:anaerobic ribonucleoside-triphosphate reductase activating protein